jgi:[acyl-carrier-protein] S-malonyltransferase
MGLGVLCPGQGSQHPKMMDILSGNDRAGRVLAEAGQALGQDVREWIRPTRDIYQNQIAQPLLCATEFATWAALAHLLPPPVAFAGYSVGELAAYGCAGALPATALARLARDRAVLMDETSHQRGSLTATRGLPRPRVEALCRQTGAEIAIVNGYDRFVVGAVADDMAVFSDAAEQLGASVTPLRVEVAAHTSQLKSAGAAFRTLLDQPAFSDPLVPVISGIHGMPIRDRKAAITALSDQIFTTIDWAACLRTLEEMGCTVFLELGPGTTLTCMVRESIPGIPARSVEDFRALPAVADWVCNSLKRTDWH